jgi:hypothetical protein
MGHSKGTAKFWTPIIVLMPLKLNPHTCMCYFSIACCKRGTSREPLATITLSMRGR